MQMKWFFIYPSQKITIMYMIVISLLMISTCAYGSEGKTIKKKDITSFRIGFWGPGQVSVSGHDYDLKSGYSLGFNVDTPRDNRFYTGFAIDIYGIYPEDTDESVSLYNFGFVIKRDYPLKISRLSFRPSITIGFALKPKLSFVGNSGHFTIKASVDIISNVDKPVSFLIEGGFFWIVAGMENQTKIYSYPAPVLRIGLMF